MCTNLEKKSSKQYYFHCPQEIIYAIFSVPFCGKTMFLRTTHEGKCYNVNVLVTVLVAIWLNKMKKTVNKLLLNDEENLMNVTRVRL